jgi:putative membrane protein
MLDTLGSNVIAAVIFAVLGITVFLVAFVVVDRLTPYTLWKEIIEEHNTALAILIGSIALGMSIIVAAAII